MTGRLVPILLLALFASAWAADEGKFYPPEGWTVAKQPNGTVAVQPPGVPAAKTCAVLIMPDSEGEVNAVHATGWRLLTRELKVVSGGEPRAGRTMADYEMRSTAAVVDAADTGRAYMYAFAVQVGPRVRRALFLCDDKASFDKHLPTVKSMFDSVGIDPAKAKQMHEAAKGVPTRFEGAFYRGAVEFVPAGAPGERAMRVDYLFLAPDGRAYTGHPAGGPIGRFEAEDLRSPNWGRYTLRGDNIEIRWHFDRTLNRQHVQRLKRRADGKLEQEGGAVYHRFDPCDGLKLDGTFGRTWGDGSKTRVRFTRDGRFTEQGLKSCLADDDSVDPDLPKVPERGAGTYSITRNTLEVKYDGGPTRRMFFATPDDPADPKSVTRIAISNKPLVKVP